MRQCDNCGAKLPENVGGMDHNGHTICCPHCIFSPLGCRCKYGEFEVAETYEDPDFPMFDDDEEENLEDFLVDYEDWEYDMADTDD